MSRPCRICGKERPAGYSATCGRSACQEADYYDVISRWTRVGSDRRRLALQQARAAMDRAVPPKERP